MRSAMTKTQRRRAQRKRAMYKSGECYPVEHVKPNSWFFPDMLQPSIKTKTTKETTMNCSAMNINAPAPNTDSDVRYSERGYLEGRAYYIRAERAHKARVTFGMADDKSPKSPAELVKRIQSGMYVLPTEWDEDSDDTCPQWFINRIKWRNPATVKDHDGYEAALKVLDAEYQKLLDAIKIKEPAEALTELQAWEATA